MLNSLRRVAAVSRWFSSSVLSYHGGVYDSILDCIGETPMVRLNNIPEIDGIECEVLAKCEFFNPGGSIKDRAARRIIEDALASGALDADDPDNIPTVVEATSGNTGVGLALVSAVKGFNFLATLPERMSREKEIVMGVLGGDVIRTPDVPTDHPDSNLSLASRLVSEVLENALFADQFYNSSNVAAHYEETGEEILRQCDGKIDVLVHSAGTGGTITGVSRRLKESNPDLVTVCIDPVGSEMALLSTFGNSHETILDYHEEDQFWAPYKVEGVGYDFIPGTFDFGYVDYWMKVPDRDAFRMARRIIQEEGILAGGSSGLILAGAKKFLLHENGGVKLGLNKPGKRVVVIFPDGERNYLSGFVDALWMLEKGMISAEEYQEQFGQKEKYDVKRLEKSRGMQSKVEGK